MKKKFFYTSIFLLIIAAACKNNDQKNAAKIPDSLHNTINIDTGKQDYTIYVPKGWTTRHQFFGGNNYYSLTAPKTETDPNTNINITTENMQKFSLDAYREQSITALKKALAMVAISGKGDILANGLKGDWYSYTMEYKTDHASLVSYIFSKDSTAYIITAGTQIKNAAHYRSTFDSVARSFRFNK